MLVPLEHALLTRETAARDRTAIFARYSLIGALTAAVGSLAAALPELLASLGWSRLSAIKADVLSLCRAGPGGGAALPRGCRATTATSPARRRRALGPSKGIVYKLAALFSMDAFAGGFVVQSLLALWLFQRFDLSLEAASVYLLLLPACSARSRFRWRPGSPGASA